MDDRDQVEQQFRGVEPLLPALNPPLLGLVVQESGAAMAMWYPRMEWLAADGTASEHHAALGAIHRALIDLAASVQTTRVNLERRWSR